MTFANYYQGLMRDARGSALPSAQDARSDYRRALDWQTRLLF